MKILLLFIVFYALTLFSGYAQSKVSLVKNSNGETIEIDSNRTVFIFMKSGVEFHSRVFNLKGDTLYLRDTSMLINDIEQIAYCYRNHDEVIAADVAFGVGAIFATVYVHNFFYNEDWLNSEKAPYVAVMGNGIIVMAIAMLVINIHSFKKTYFDLTEKWKLKSNKSGS